MMASGRFADYLGMGVIGDRPAAPVLLSYMVGLWYSTDTLEWSAWNGSVWLEDIMAGGGGAGVVETIVAGTGITVDSTDPANPIVAATGGGTGTVDSIIGGTGIDVDATDPANPIANLDSASIASLALADSALQAAAIGSSVQAYDADLTTIAGLTATSDSFLQAKSSAWASRTVAQVSVDLQGTGLITDAVGFRTIPQNSQSAAYTLVAADSGKHILHPSADTTARTMTIPANSSVAFPVGTAVTFINQSSAGVMTIAITTDTMRLAGAGTTGSRTLAANGIATAIKVTSTEWIISGTGLT